MNAPTGLAHGSAVEGIATLPRKAIWSALARRLASTLGYTALSIIVVVILWEGFISFFHLPPEIAKSPLDVWRYLFSQRANSVEQLRSAAGNRQVLFGYLRTTLRDAGLGYIAGFVFGLGVACAFVLLRLLRQTFMPVAIVLRAMPLVAMVPLITLVFGRSVVCVMVIGGIICFFPALINIMHGLQSTPPAMLDLMSCYGAGKLTTMRKVLIPSALPSIFASLRINVPGAMIGALLAEWLATGQGSGGEMLTVVNTFDFGALWSAVVLVTLVTIIAYSIVSAIEATVLSRYAPEALSTGH